MIQDSYAKQKNSETLEGGMVCRTIDNAIGGQ